VCVRVSVYVSMACIESVCVVVCMCVCVYAMHSERVRMCLSRAQRACVRMYVCVCVYDMHRERVCAGV
jgi:hypothetical protein